PAKLGPVWAIVEKFQCCALADHRVVHLFVYDEYRRNPPFDDGPGPSAPDLQNLIGIHSATIQDQTACRLKVCHEVPDCGSWNDWVRKFYVLKMLVPREQSAHRNRRSNCTDRARLR